MILSFHSNVMHGHVGNGAGLPIYHAFGLPVSHLDTVRLAAHPGHGTTARDVISAPDMAAILSDYLSLKDRPPLSAIHTGYFGKADQIAPVADFITRVKQQQPQLPVLIDPVFGDNGRLYISEDIITAIRRDLLPLATIITPNQFEISYLSDMSVDTPEEARRAFQKLGLTSDIMAPDIMAPDIMAIVTGLKTPPDDICDILICHNDIITHKAPALSHGISGGGDAFAALFLACLHKNMTPEQALHNASQITYLMLQNSKNPLTLNIASGLEIIETQMTEPSR
ncbi:MAG: bifunctional hydroxymethylpyrimidine kinase/phosphomethylpyrimidine kinase [Candidatus Puniceispirillaceae bacterium]